MKLQAVLYVSHGTRDEEGKLEVAEFMNKSMPNIDVPIQEYCFLELANPSIEDGILRLKERGATKIAVIPLLLFLAGHAKRDIPKQIEEMRKKFPNLSFSIGRPFGVHDLMVDILVDRMLEKQPEIYKTARILLVGRGSSDPDTKRYFHDIETRLRKKTSVSNISTCYLAACEPDVETGLDSVLADEEADQIFIIPYLLFTGILLKRLEHKVSKLLKVNRNLFLCRQLHYHPNLVLLLKERVFEAVEKR